jgi:hypothetical protein
MRELPPVPPTPMPPRPLPVHNLAPMVVAGLVFQATASGPVSFAAAAWLCLLPLLVLVRCVPLWQALAFGFGVPFVGRFVAAAATMGIGADAVVAAAVIAGLTLLVLLSHRLVMRELPLLGAFAAPAAVVVVEAVAGHFAWPGSTLLPLSSTQAADVPFWRFVDVLTPLGISFGVAWGQSVMAGFGEAWLADDPHPQLLRERGLRLAANLCFWLLVVVGHGGGLWRADPLTTTPAHSGSVAALAMVILAGLVVGAVVMRLRTSTPAPSGSPA